MECIKIKNGEKCVVLTSDLLLGRYNTLTYTRLRERVTLLKSKSLQEITSNIIMPFKAEVIEQQRFNKFQTDIVLSMH